MRTFIGVIGVFDRISAKEIIVPAGFVETTGPKRDLVLKALEGGEPPGLTKADANYLRALSPEAKVLLLEALSGSAQQDAKNEPTEA
jgi:hypothetical protein